jgi:hypothetical protein
LRRLDELGSYLNRELVEQAKDQSFSRDLVSESFNKTFDFLSSTLHENAFRRHDSGRNRYMGPMLVSLFEVVAVGLCYHLQNGGSLPDSQRFAERHKMLWAELGQMPFVGSGVRASTRVPETVAFGRDWVSR